MNKDIIEDFGFDPGEISLRSREFGIENAETINPDEKLLGVQPGYLWVLVLGGGGNNPMDPKSVERVNFIDTKEVKGNIPHRLYWFRPLTQAEKGTKS